jgi:hypothetical protein
MTGIEIGIRNRELVESCCFECEIVSNEGYDGRSLIFTDYGSIIGDVRT